MKSSAVHELLTYVIGEQEADEVTEHVHVSPTILEQTARGRVDRAVIAQALSLVLFHDILHRVPSARRYVFEFKKSGERLVLDHAAVTTVKLEGMGKLPSGDVAIRRLLVPLGFAVTEEGELGDSKLFARAYRHLDFPEDIPHFLVTEILVEQFPSNFQEAVLRTVGASRNPTSASLERQLTQLEERGSLEFHDAADVVLKVARCFERQHDLPTVDDYSNLLEQSFEMAWASTEGNVVNHVTFQVDDIETLHGKLQEAKFEIEPVQKGAILANLMRAALAADKVSRRLRGPSGSALEKEVPSSFVEFVQRDNSQRGIGRARLICNTAAPISQS